MYQKQAKIHILNKKKCKNVQKLKMSKIKIVENVKNVQKCEILF